MGDNVRDSTLDGKFPSDFTGEGEAGGGGGGGTSEPLSADQYKVMQPLGNFPYKGYNKPQAFYINDAPLGGTLKGVYTADVVVGSQIATMFISGTQSGSTINFSSAMSANTGPVLGPMFGNIFVSGVTGSPSAYRLSASLTGMTNEYFTKYAGGGDMGYVDIYPVTNSISTLTLRPLMAPALQAQLNKVNAGVMGDLGPPARYDRGGVYGTVNAFPHTSFSANLKLTVEALGGGGFSGFHSVSAQFYSFDPANFSPVGTV